MHTNRRCIIGRGGGRGRSLGRWPAAPFPIGAQRFGRRWPAAAPRLPSRHSALILGPRSSFVSAAAAAAAAAVAAAAAGPTPTATAAATSSSLSSPTPPAAAAAAATPDAVREERTKALRERHNEERQRKLDELKQQVSGVGAGRRHRRGFPLAEKKGRRRRREESVCVCVATPQSSSRAAAAPTSWRNLKWSGGGGGGGAVARRTTAGAIRQSPTCTDSCASCLLLSTSSSSSTGRRPPRRGSANSRTRSDAGAWRSSASETSSAAIRYVRRPSLVSRPCVRVCGCWRHCQWRRHWRPGAWTGDWVLRS